MIFFTLLYPPMALIVCLMYCLYGATRKKVKFDKIMVFFIVSAFSVYGYSLTNNPVLEFDLVRYFEQIEKLKSKNLFSILLSDKQLLYTCDILFYFIGKTDNLCLLPFIVAFSIYGICSYVLYDYIKRNNLKLSTFQLLFLLFTTVGIVNSSNVIANVRCVNSYAIIVFAVYRELVQKKTNLITIFLYIIAIGLHTTAVAVVIMRLLYPLLAKLFPISLIPVLFSSQIITVAYNFRTLFPQLIIQFIEKAYYYLNWIDADIIENSTSISYRVSYLFCICYIGISVILIFYHDYIYKNKKIMNNKFIQFIYSIIILVFGNFAIPVGSFWRFAAIVYMFSHVYLIPLMQCKNQIIKICLYGIFIGTLFMILFNFIYIFIYLSPIEMLEKGITVTSIRIFMDFIKGVYNF